eukprot:5183341-Pleurochrysis_carterae.AAC.1
MLLLAVYFAVSNAFLPVLLRQASADVSRAIRSLIDTRASAAASASAIAIAVALAGPSEAVSICSFAVPVSTAAHLSRLLLAPAASLAAIFVAVAACALVAYDATRASAD